ncbi:MAG: RNA helicase [Peltula sp. TS41687]|nr:MAG: RNA helicase [Peltula sp. TS41687]
MARLAKRQRSRMVLSPNVARGTQPARSTETASRRSSAGPFGGMNLREARIPARPEQQSGKRMVNRDGRRETGSSRHKPDYHALKMQRALSEVPYRERTSVKTSISEVDSFDKFPLLPAVGGAVRTQVLKELDYVHPTPIQRLAIPALLGIDGWKSKGDPKEMKHFLLAAETGSGKTLAYLLPTIDAIKRAEALEVEEAKRVEEEEAEAKKAETKQNMFELEPPPLSNDPHNSPGRPRAIILLPTSELVSQVGGVVKLLSHTIKYRSSLISSAYTGRVIRSRLFSPGGIDILISTPHLISSIADSDPNILSRVTHLIIDEADSLLDRSFSPLTSAIIDRSTPSLRQLILCSATIPRSLDSFLRQRFPDMRRLVTPNLHAIPRRVQLAVVDVEKDPYRGSKDLACADTIWTIGRAAAEHAESHGESESERADIKRIIVFVNEREKAQDLAEYLTSKGIQATALNRDTTEQRQSQILSSFTSSTGEETTPSVKASSDDPSSSPPSVPNNNTSQYIPVSKSPQSPQKRSLPNTKVLVMTDLGSRGIDTLAVRHVILYDVPHTTIDFIHRLGRMGRMGKRGRGIVLVGKHDRRDVVREVREGMFKGQALI